MFNSATFRSLPVRPLFFTMAICSRRSRVNENRLILNLPILNRLHRSPAMAECSTSCTITRVAHGPAAKILGGAAIGRARMRCACSSFPLITAMSCWPPMNCAGHIPGNRFKPTASSMLKAGAAVKGAVCAQSAHRAEQEVQTVSRSWALMKCLNAQRAKNITACVAALSQRAAASNPTS